MPHTGYAARVRSKGGTLDKEELGHAFETIGCGLKPTELDAVMSDMNGGGNGEVRARPTRALK